VLDLLWDYSILSLAFFEELLVVYVQQLVQQACSQQSFMAATSSSFQHLSYLLKYRL
jgi:hypothetical protein